MDKSPDLDLPIYQTSSEIVKSIGFENFDYMIVAEFPIGNWKERSIAAYRVEQELIKECWGNENLLNRRYYDGLNSYVDNRGKVTVIDKNGNRYHVDKEVYDSDGTLKSINAGLVLVYDKHGNKIKVTQDEYCSSEYTHVNSNILTAIDLDGNQVQITPQEYKENRHKYKGTPSTGQVTVKDSNGNIFNVSVEDPRYVSGELKHIQSGKQKSEACRQKIRDTITNIPKVWCETCQKLVHPNSLTRHNRSINHLQLLIS
jgi:hypothetical protein